MEVRVLFEGENRIAVEPKFKKKEHMSQVKDHNLIFRDLEARETKTAIIRGEINQISVHTEENFNALLPKLEAIKLLKYTMTLTQMSPKPLLILPPEQGVK